MAQKPSIPKGTRDFSPVEMARRNYIFDTIREVFRLYGFRQIETPAMENLSTLMGKYGEEGDKLLFKILNSGNYLKSADHELLNAEEPSGRLTSQLCEKGLRYDLTVPFARYVVMHRNELQLPFKRFQIQPVWRADRPQKGRYREFYQCDADIVGSDSLVNEIELLQIIDEVFSRLGIRIAIKLNNRKVLAGIAELIGAPDKLIDITVVIDKIDKIGIDNVVVELRERGLSEDAVERLRPILAISGSLDERLSALSSLLADTTVGVAGVEELRAVVSGVESLGMKAQLDLDVSLARGLNYYTGTIIEVKALDVQIGSITGISFGADRIYDVLNTLDLYPENTSAASKVIFLNLGADESTVSLKAAKMLRASGIAAEVYPDTVKMKKQMAYADAMRIPFVAIIGETELESGTVTLKDMEAGNQETVALDDLVARLS